jgi:hypothetical protein
MAKLRVTLVDGNVSEHRITPSVEFAFEAYAKKGFSRAFREDELQTHIFWISWECLRRANTLESIPAFGPAYIDLLDKVEVLDDVPN